jgi:hypothetical protein
MFTAPATLILVNFKVIAMPRKTPRPDREDLTEGSRP